MLGEVSDSTTVVEDSSNSPNVNDPSSVLRSSSLSSSDPSGDRGKGTEVIGTISGLGNVEGLNGGVSSHGEHMGVVVRGDGSVTNDVGKRAVSWRYPRTLVDVGAMLRNVSWGRSIAFSAAILRAIDMAVG